MSKSIQDQLQALGLASKSGAAGTSPTGRKARADDKRHESGTSGPPGRIPAWGKGTAHEELSLEDAFRLRERQSRMDASETRERKREEDRRRRALNSEIRAIVETNRLNCPDADRVRNFLHKNRIRRIYVTAEQLQALNAGKLGLAYLSGCYHLLTAELVAKVAELSAEHVPDLTGGMEEDPEFPVPDDLAW